MAMDYMFDITHAVICPRTLIRPQQAIISDISLESDNELFLYSFHFFYYNHLYIEYNAI